MIGAFAGLSGSYSQSDTKTKSKSQFWTRKQREAEKKLGEWVGGQELGEVAPYTGQLAGTYTPETMSALFRGAQQYAAGGPLTQREAGPWEQAPPEGSQLFAHYRQYADPAQREAQIASRLEARRRLLAPEREKEDAALKAQARAMGLEYSSDVLKKQADVAAVRQAEEDLIASDLLDRYEQLGFEASEAALQQIQGISSLQYQIVNAGLQAEFDEWLRTQPDYDPMIDIYMAYLGLQGISETRGKAQTTAWSVSGSGGASYGA